MSALAELKSSELKKKVVHHLKSITDQHNIEEIAKKYDPHRFNITGVKCKKCGGPHKTLTHVREQEENEKGDIKPKKPSKPPPPQPVDPVSGHIESFNLDDVKIRKLQKFLELQQTRKNHLHRTHRHKLEGESNQQALIRKIEEMIKSKHRQFVDQRLSESGASALTRLAMKGDEYMLRRHLEAASGGININARDGCTGRTLLVEASSGGHYTVARMLCREYKASPRVATMLGGATALHVAVQQGHRQICALLLTHGADVNAVDKQGNTPLHYCRSMLILRLLFKFPCDPLVKNRKKEIPSQFYRNASEIEDLDPDLWAGRFTDFIQTLKIHTPDRLFSPLFLLFFHCGTHHTSC